MRASEAADLIQRFLDGKELYPQEWNDFIEATKVQPEVELARKRCYELDPRVNCPNPPAPDALAELKEMVSALRKIEAPK